jgi:single-strand DNA-binding protein
VRFTLVNERSFGEGEPRKTFLDCVAFGKKMESVKELRKGDMVMVTGSLEKNGVEKDGKKTYYTNIIVDQIDMLSTNGTTNDHPF